MGRVRRSDGAGVVQGPLTSAKRRRRQARKRAPVAGASSADVVSAQTSDSSTDAASATANHAAARKAALHRAPARRRRDGAEAGGEGGVSARAIPVCLGSWSAGSNRAAPYGGYWQD